MGDMKENAAEHAKHASPLATSGGPSANRGHANGVAHDGLTQESSSSRVLGSFVQSRRFELRLFISALLCLAIAVVVDLLGREQAARFPLSANILAGVLVTPFLTWAAIVVFARIQVRAEERHKRELVREYLGRLVGTRLVELGEVLRLNPLFQSATLEQLRSLIAAASQVIEQCGSYSWSPDPSVDEQFSAVLQSEPEGLKSMQGKLESLGDELRQLLIYSDGRLHRQSVERAMNANHRAQQLVETVLRGNLITGLRVMQEPGATWDGEKILRKDGGTYTFHLKKAVETVKSIAPARDSLQRLIECLDEVPGLLGPSR